MIKASWLYLVVLKVQKIFISKNCWNKYLARNLLLANRHGAITAQI